MLAAFKRAASRRAQVVSLVGETGTGKSRLVAELFNTLEAHGRLAGASVRRTICSSFGEQVYGVLRAFLREGYRLAPGDSRPYPLASRPYSSVTTRRWRSRAT